MTPKYLRAVCTAAMLVVALNGTARVSTQGRNFKAQGPRFTDSIAFDVSPALRDLARTPGVPKSSDPDAVFVDPRRDRGRVPADNGFSGDHAVEAGRRPGGVASAAIAAPLANFEGLSNQDNFNIFGGRVNPPDPVGDVGPNHYVEMINLTFAVYDKQGNLLLGPLAIGSLWAGFEVTDCGVHPAIRSCSTTSSRIAGCLTQFTSAA